MRDTGRGSADGCDGQLAGGGRLGGPGRQVPVEVGAGDAGLGDDLGNGVPGGAQVGGVVELGPVDGDRPADPAALGGRDRAGVGGPLKGVSAFHLPEQGEQHHGELRHRIGRVAGVHPDRVSQVADPDAA